MAFQLRTHRSELRPLVCGSDVIHATMQSSSDAPNDFNQLREMFQNVVRALIEDKSACTVAISTAPDGTMLFSMSCKASDIGRLTGVGGRTSREVRVVVAAFGKKIGRQSRLDLPGRNEFSRFIRMT